MSDARFLVTARKYRPQRFEELVAQEHVTGTLKNAVRLDRLAHAYLFTGPRGVGKTTAARILAKAINCTAPASERADGSEPCRACESCRSFEEGRNLNIIEIDAASNNKVDDVRDLRETVRIPPQGNRKKVYIVDEVHMLTTQAFNALLKTLEEPPPHVLFIFATTEPHKVLPTIQSRCQRFDFRRIPLQDIVEQLRSICAAESITADEGSLVLMARRGDGALRDALSVFDQAVSLCGENLGIDELARALGVVGEDLFFDASDAVLRGDGPAMLHLVDRIARSGYDLLEFLDGLAEHLRNLFVALTMPDAELIEASRETRMRYAAHATSFTEARLLRLLALTDRALEELRVSRQPRLRLELALLQMASLPSEVDLRAVLARLEGAEPPARPAPGPSSKPSSAGPVPSATTPALPAAAPAVPVREARPLPAPPPADPAPARPAPPTVPAERFSSDDEDEEPGWAPPQGPSLFDAPPAAEPARGSSPPPVRTDVTPALGQPALRIERPQRPDDSRAALRSAPSDVVDVLDTGVPEFWDDFVDRVRQDRIQISALLSHARAAVGTDGTLVLSVPDDFHVRAFRDAQALLERHLLEASGGSFSAIRSVVHVGETDRESAEPTAIDPQEAVKDLAERYPAVKSLMERFGGEIVW